METLKNKKIHPGNVVLSVIAVLVITAAIIFFGTLFMDSRKYLETNDAQVEAYINPISARAGGFITKVKFEEHKWVKQGDTLVIIDDREYREQLTEAEAALDDAKAQLNVLSASINFALTGTLVNQSQIDGAKARMIQQQSDIKRYKNLMKEEATTGSDLELVQSKYDVSVSDFNGARNSLKTSYAKVAELKSQKALLIADIKRKTALFDLAKINLGYTIIRAPYSGRMGRKNIQEGQQIQAGQPLVSIVDEREKWITANFKETQVYGMYVGQPVNIKVDAIDGKVYQGEIEAISASTGAKFSLLPPDNATGNFVKIVQRVPVKIKFTSKDIDPVKAGMNVLVSVQKRAL